MQNTSRKRSQRKLQCKKTRQTACTTLVPAKVVIGQTQRIRGTGHQAGARLAYDRPSSVDQWGSERREGGNRSHRLLSRLAPLPLTTALVGAAQAAITTAANRASSPHSGGMATFRYGWPPPPGTHHRSARAFSRRRRSGRRARSEWRGGWLPSRPG